MPELLFYTTAGCHLCECAAAMLAELGRSRTFRLTPVDIGASEALVARYGLKIPVVRGARGGGELNWPFVAGQVFELLEAESG